MPAILPHRSPSTIFRRSGGLRCAAHIHPPSRHQYPSLEREGGSLLAQSQVLRPLSLRLPAATSTSLLNIAISPSHRRRGRKKRERRKWKPVSPMLTSRNPHTISPVVVSKRVSAPVQCASCHVIFTLLSNPRATCIQCFLLMAPMCTRCVLFTLLYSLALLWGCSWTHGYLFSCLHRSFLLRSGGARLQALFVSGAVNAALIGTAVGLTVYRLYVLSCALSSYQRFNTLAQMEGSG
jgi:hypothetical protein